MGESSTEIFNRIREARIKRVRYGRANLTFARWGGLNQRGLGKALRAYEDGSIRAADVGDAFVKDRLERHTASFNWDDVNWHQLLELAVKASTEPEFPSSDPNAVADILVQAARAERKTAKASREGFKRQFEPYLSIKRMANMITSANREVLSTAEKYSGVVGNFQNLGMPRLLELREKNAVFVTADQMSGFQKGLTASWAHSGGGALPQGFTLKGLGIDTASITASFLAGRGPTASISEQWKAQGARDFGAAISLVEWANQMKRISTQFSGANLTGQYAIGDASRLFPRLPTFGKLFDGVSDALKTWREHFEEALPENWRNLDRDELDAAVELTTKAGPCVAWAPRTEIIRELIAAKDYPERCAVLEAHGAEIVEDVEAVLNEVTREDLSESVEGVHKVIAAARDGHPEAAQALAGVVVTHLVHDFLEAENFGPVREAFGDVDPWNDVGITQLSFYAVGRGWVRTFERIPKAGDDFNRNVTLHVLGPAHNEANLLGALLLLGGLIPELERMQNRHDARELQAA